MERQNLFDEIHDCVIKARVKPQRRKDKVHIGCGAGFGGDRPLAALKLLNKVKELNYLVLECLAERTLAERCQVMMSGGDGYDSRISEWMSRLLPLAVERGTCIITNMGAMDPVGAQENVVEIASSLGLSVTVAVAQEVSLQEFGMLACLWFIDVSMAFHCYILKQDSITKPYLYFCIFWFRILTSENL
ncbi:hypothetical protein SLEP1_g10060 [Rubroshorea leprosula]|uniref:Acyclic terpene utilisation N-terminal domain-containing protein n=1 Tax=Rubroshorea leprosula TaxID=152421 RepID=A0AAV5I6X0_9ROSI|nr:hypothetical protein SLEP1_g10060 [Rubroshorea leprosula]